MSPSLRSESFKKPRKSKQEATLKLKYILRSKNHIQSTFKTLHKKRKVVKHTNFRFTPKMGQKFSCYVRRGPNGLKTKSSDEAEQRSTNIDEVPHPNETLGLRIKLFGPTNVILVIRTNPSYEDALSLQNISSPSHNNISSSIHCRIHAHREVLCMRSKYFYSMLQGPHKSKFRNNYLGDDISITSELQFCEKNDDEINLVSIYKKTPTEMADMVGQILHFLYFDQRALNPDNVQTLLEAANYFQVTTKTSTSHFINLLSNYKFQNTS